jgi:hypothetical protein
MMSHFLHALDAYFSALGSKILLFMEIMPLMVQTHPLRNVKVVSYPSNCTSVVQPFDLGLIKCFKQLYRKHCAVWSHEEESGMVKRNGG